MAFMFHAHPVRLTCQDELILRRMLFKLYHIEESIEGNVHQIKSKNKSLVGLRQEHRAQEKALDAARAEQAKSRTSVMQVERNIKKAEKALDGKVSCLQPLLIQGKP